MHVGWIVGIVILVIIIVLILVIGAIYTWLLLRKLYNAKQEPKPVKAVNLKYYQGKWHEVARIPTFFQRGCTNTTAEYKLDPSKDFVEVINKCDLKNGREKMSVGKAYPNRITRIDRNPNNGDFWVSPAALKVGFNNPFWGNYEIYALDDRYQWAAVGGQGVFRNYLWILSRNPNMEKSTYDNILSTLRDKNVPGVDKLKMY